MDSDFFKLKVHFTHKQFFKKVLHLYSLVDQESFSKGGTEEDLLTQKNPGLGFPV